MIDKRTFYLLVALFFYAGSFAQKNSPDLKANGVSYYDSSKAQNGVTVLDRFTESYVIDMHGKMLAKLPMGLVNFQPDGPIVGRADSVVVKTDADMNILWTVPDDHGINHDWQIHHEITVDENGGVYLLSSDVHDFMGRKMRFDVLKIYSGTGKLIYKWCVFDHLKEVMDIISKSAWCNSLPVSLEQSSGIEDYISQDPERFFMPVDGLEDDSVPLERRLASFELTHFNSIQVLPENEVSKKIPAFKKGNLLLSFNPYSSYGILDTGTGKIAWVGYLPYRSTLHTPNLTKDGTILVFENYSPKMIWGGKSRRGLWLKYLPGNLPQEKQTPNTEERLWAAVCEYDPVTNSKVWEYTANPKESLMAKDFGSCQRLPNGNTLICARTYNAGGRVFEVTPEKETVWNYVFPKNNPETKLPLEFYRAKRIIAQGQGNENAFIRSIADQHNGRVFEATPKKEIVQNNSPTRTNPDTPLPFAINYQFPLKLTTEEKSDKYDSKEYHYQEDILQLKIYNDVTKEEAWKIIQDKKFFIYCLFKDQISPYPGVISNTLGCPEELKPKPKLDATAVRLDYNLMATSNLIFGNCNAKDNYYNCMYTVFFCPSSNKLFEVKLFTPIKKPSFNYDDIAASLGCKK